MTTRIPLFVEGGCALFGIVLGAALAAYCGWAPSVVHELESTRTQLHAVENRLATSEHAREVLATVRVATDSRRHQQATADTNRVIDRDYDPTSGKLVHEHSEARAHVASQQSAEAHTAASTQVAVQETARTQVDTHVAVEQRQEHVHEVVHANAETGFSVGLLATIRGAGPAVGWQLAALGPLKVRVVAGAIPQAPQVGPRVGVVVGGQVLPAIDLGVGAVLAPGGQEPLAYPLGPVDVVPALSLQYRF